MLFFASSLSFAVFVLNAVRYPGRPGDRLLELSQGHKHAAAAGEITCGCRDVLSGGLRTG
jgi:hypothetical protein